MAASADDILTLAKLLEQIRSPDGGLRLFWLLFPFFLLVDLPLALIVTLGVFRWWVREHTLIAKTSLYRPRVSCIVPCYTEGFEVQKTFSTLVEQTYKGEIEIIPVIDGASQNRITMQAVRQFRIDQALHPRRLFRPLAKWQRGGRVSTLNAGLSMSTGEIVIALDGDTSFDNNTISSIARHFEDPNVPAVAGSLRVRNAWQSLATVLQAIEYCLSIQMAKIGFSEINAINNISGAFGAFRRSVLVQIGGWDTHTAEDFDLTIRIKNYFARNPKLRIPFEPRAIGHTDAPATFQALFQHRLRWDGDLLFIYARKHPGSLSPSLMGWSNYLMMIYSGIFVQVISPFIIVGYTFVCLLTLPLETVVALFVFMYLFYLAVSYVMFFYYLVMVSERARKDARLLWLIPLFPVGAFAIRCWSSVAMLNEWWRRGHEESSMAPYWVLRGAKRF